MPYRNPETTVFPSRLEFRQIYRHCTVWRVRLHSVTDLGVIRVLGPVIHHPLCREFDETPPATFDDVGNVIPHERRIIEKLLAHQVVERVLRESIVRSPEPPRLNTRYAPYGVESPHEPIFFFLRGKRVWLLVKVAVQRNLMTGFDY